jgi:two-component system torCAD operon response regulator TorR
VWNCFRTLDAGSGAELWAHASSGPIQLFLLDLKLPGESGLSIAKDIRRKSDVGIVTGKTEEIDRVVGPTSRTGVIPP